MAITNNFSTYRKGAPAKKKRLPTYKQMTLQKDYIQLRLFDDP